jgi:hypothetical protein
MNNTPSDKEKEPEKKEPSTTRVALKAIWNIFLALLIFTTIGYGCRSCNQYIRESEYTIMIESQPEDYEILQVFSSSSQDKTLQVTLQHTKTKERYEKQFVSNYFYEWNDIPIGTIIKLRKVQYTYFNGETKMGFAPGEILREIRKIAPEKH